MTWSMKFSLAVASLLIAFGLGLGAGWKFYRPKSLPPTAVMPRPPETMPDGGTVVERKADLRARPQQDVPQGDQVEDQGTLIIQGPTAPPGPSQASPAVNSAPPVSQPCPPCPPVTIKWSWVTEPDGGKRLVVLPVGGSLVAGDDIIVRPPAPAPADLPWSGGASYYLRERAYGVWIDRRVGPFVLGGEVKQARAEFGSGRLSVDAAVRIGVRF